ncbi:MAG: hypothetical protein KKD11_01060 [Candidatus Omnitrophica bacterium]|nr:hypothetical protein [Candidatus Omnitrophota bacterium]
MKIIRVFILWLVFLVAIILTLTYATEDSEKGLSTVTLIIEPAFHLGITDATLVANGE